MARPGAAERRRQKLESIVVSGMPVFVVGIEFDYGFVGVFSSQIDAQAWIDGQHSRRGKDMPKTPFYVSEQVVDEVEWP